MPLTQFVFKKWQNRAGSSDNELDRLLPIPTPPLWQRTKGFEVKAVSKINTTPNSYVLGSVAQKACINADKHLCSEEEWVYACMGEDQTKFPYGEEYIQGRCNVFRLKHPAYELHGDFGSDLDDPRLINVLEKPGKPLLRKTGTSNCVSKWGEDGIHDMVGNLAEWVDDPKRASFLGGSMSRSTKEGCESKFGTGHPQTYFDYSLGMRCCKTL